ncbi:hypothetical protein EMIHUDRAFT_211781 [Emiliania huxleyi CCMP1516]|uniref:Pentapeptide repeat-containing protein n=2 Tax=Emiliania huxleyi TaxID=2903 RepID=A0A0D3ISX9_EMIH1|nr:hypothetical protein EMIHUDRAFT_211781 [Emiliania huxleyi CCMP1516]EOD14364.1 hypothetical protein EMIHUDRAFT_211781 [Emiliania huxleyi CCMP1516]|eukprot:XP_005766793.1 hypothetical protein EMIHUDRAFT_211781 [Emiliania huxleyi CCMP1516]
MRGASFREASFTDAILDSCHFDGETTKERKKTDDPREGGEDGTPPPHRDFKERGETTMSGTTFSGDLSFQFAGGLQFDRVAFKQLPGSGASFKGARRGSNLTNARFVNAFLGEADFGEALAPGSDFTGAEATKADFIKADLRGASFRSANCARQTGANEKASEERARVGAKLCSSPDINTNVCAEFDVPFMTGTPINMDTAGMDMTG